jgi:hypothetical protein
MGDMGDRFRIGRYVVRRQAFSSDLTSDTSVDGRMSLFPDAGYTGPIDEATLFFFGDFFGDLPSTGTLQGVRARLPVSEFDHWYKILQTEDPVFLSWEEKSDNTLLRLTLSTAEEPPGEGLDQSP